jgi:hypothetical protein
MVKQEQTIHMIHFRDINDVYRKQTNLIYKISMNGSKFALETALGLAL